MVGLSAFWLSGLLGVSWLQLGTPSSWDWLVEVYGFILYAPDLTPNIGLFWYYFTEVFKELRVFFTFFFQYHFLIYWIPLSIKFRYLSLLLLFPCSPPPPLVVFYNFLKFVFPEKSNLFFYSDTIPFSCSGSSPLWRPCWSPIPLSVTLYCTSPSYHSSLPSYWVAFSLTHIHTTSLNNNNKIRKQVECDGGPHACLPHSGGPGDVAYLDRQGHRQRKLFLCRHTRVFHCPGLDHPRLHDIEPCHFQVQPPLQQIHHLLHTHQKR